MSGVVGEPAPVQHGTFSDGVRAGLPLVLPTLILGISFGVLAKPVMGSVAPVVMSIVVCAGSAQFAALSVLTAGGGAGTAITAGLLMNARFIPMGFAVGPSLRGRPLWRALQGQAVIDASWALASRGGGRFDRLILLGATPPQVSAWMLGTLLGVLGGDLLGDPQALGLDAIFPAFYLALLAEELRNRRALPAALLGAAITLSLLPVAPLGLAVIAAGAAALLGLRRA
jgi:predicted branched-subunit amino acid permease